MARLFLLIVLFVLSGYFMLLARSLQYMGLRELRRRARAGDSAAKKVYGVRVYGMQVWIVLWALLGLAISAIILLLESLVWTWLALVIDAVLLVLLHAVLPWSRRPEPNLRLAANASGWLTRVLKVARPFLERLTSLTSKWLEPEPMKIMHSKEELLEVLEHTASQVDPVSRDELHIAEHALQFGDKAISEVMTPRSVVKLVDGDEVLSPVVLTELHDSGFSRFPVYRDNTSNLVGTLYLKDAIKHKEGKRIHDIMRPDIYFVNERQSLDHVLSAFLRTHHHQFIVVNEYEDITGVITIEDILEQILGKPIIDEFDQYEDLRAVAALTAEQRKRSRDGETIQ